MIEATAPHDEMIKHKIDAAESRLEKVILREMHEVHKEISQVRKDINMLHTRLTKVESSLNLIQGVGGLFISIVTIAGTVFGVLHLHLMVG